MPHKKDVFFDSWDSLGRPFFSWFGRYNDGVNLDVTLSQHDGLNELQNHRPFCTVLHKLTTP